MKYDEMRIDNSSNFVMSGFMLAWACSGGSPGSLVVKALAACPFTPDDA